MIHNSPPSTILTGSRRFLKRGKEHDVSNDLEMARSNKKEWKWGFKMGLGMILKMAGEGDWNDS